MLEVCKGSLGVGVKWVRVRVEEDGWKGERKFDYLGVLDVFLLGGK